MTSIAEAGNCSLKSEDIDASNSDYIVTESIEYTEDESHNISFISALDKSELDIELEICENILALDDNDGASSNSNEQPFEIKDFENIFDSPESVFENHPGESMDGSYQQGSENIKLECSINVHESAIQSHAETFNDTAKEQLFDNALKPLVCASHSDNKKCDCKSQDSPSNSNVPGDEFESEVKKCWDILKHEEPFDIDASVHLEQIPVQCKIKLEDIPFPISEETNEKNYKKRNCEESSDSDSVKIVYDSIIKPKKIKSEIHVVNFNLEVKREKDEDELSLFADSEFEVVESQEFPHSFKEDSDSEQDDVGTRKVSPRSVVVAPQTNYVHEERKVFSDVVLPERDYLDAERDDINDSGWESMRNLSTEEERYKLVRKTWKSSKIPDPNRNLTYHSYRKRHLKKSSAPPIARKRKATRSLDVTHINPSKRQRSCTFLYDLNIDSLSAEKQKKKAVINNQMQSEVNQLNNVYYQQEQRLQREYYKRRNNDAYGQIYNLRNRCKKEMENIKRQYHTMANQCSYELDSGIYKLNQARNEVLQFFKFYKGFNSEDPTVLTASQIQELEDIENIYLKFDELYKQ